VEHANRTTVEELAMIALSYTEFGGPEVLHVDTEAPEPHAGPGQVRVAVRTVSVNPFDCKLRAGLMAGFVPTTFPAIAGTDAAGVVDEVGEGAQGVSIGSEVFGLGSATAAQYAVLDAFAVKPEAMSWEEAAALGLAVEAAARGLDHLDLPRSATVVVDGAAGGVGSALIQLARARDLQVIATGSQASADYLRELGAVPTTYGDGLAGRVRELAPDGVDGAVDLAGRGGLQELIEITGDPRRVVTLVDFTAYPLGVQVADGSAPRAHYALADAATLYAEGRFRVHVAQVFPLAEGAQAHARLERGHVHGKLVVTVA
jgi:NADPH:quinone reductase-like Zn-dependent oxidoreductase